MSTKEKRIPVPAGIVGHNRTYNEVVLRELSYDTYFSLGEIVTVAKAPDGTIFWVENSEVLSRYVAACLVEPADPLLLAQGGLDLAREIKDTILGFFTRAGSATEPSPTLPMTSSSDASPDDSPQTQSAA